MKTDKRRLHEHFLRDVRGSASDVHIYYYHIGWPKTGDQWEPSISFSEKEGNH